MSIEARERVSLTDNLKQTIRKRVPPTMWEAAKSIRNAATSRVENYPYVRSLSIDGTSFLVELNGPVESQRTRSWTGEKHYVNDMLQAIKHDSNFYDIGAYVGTHSIPGALKAFRGWVFSFEPEEECHLALRRNIALNRLQNITAFQIALWDKTCQVELHTSGKEGQALNSTEIGSKTINQFLRKQTVQAWALEELVTKNRLPLPDVVKIDVEGAEEKVLIGMGGLRPSHIFIELHPDNGANVESIDELLKKRSYQLILAEKRGGQILCHFGLK